MKGSLLEPRSREQLIEAIAQGMTAKYLFFWGHAPAKDGQITHSCFSQWWNSHPFWVDQVEYLTAEHYMMAEKARLFSDQNILEKILSCAHPGEAKKLGRAVSGFDPEVWDKRCSDIVIAGNYHKFDQHPVLKEYILNTGSRILVEASPRDRIWGIGMSKNNPNAENPAGWRGRNLLGFALMEVRQRLLES